MIARFLNPKSIAIIGASDHEQKVGGVLMKKLASYKGKIIPVNPGHASLFGIKCYPRILDYEGEIDLAVIAIPAEFVAAALEQCGKKGIKNVIIISAGFSETGQEAAEEKLKTIAAKHGLRFLGPNCFGVCNPAEHIDLTFSVATPEKGDVAFISQSGALWSYISDFSIGKFGFSGFASLGNMANSEFGDFIEYFCRDKSTKKIVLYIEKLKDGRKFISTCRKCAKFKKSIYAVKAGASQRGQEAAFSHTASLASDYKIYNGSMKQAGVVLCESLRDAFEKATSKKLDGEPKMPPADTGEKAVIITNAGGAGALISDYCEKAGIEVVEKPIDLLGTALAADYSSTFEKIKKRKDYDVLICILTPQSMSEPEKTAEALLDFKEQSKKKVIAYFLGGSAVAAATDLLRKNKILCFNND